MDLGYPFYPQKSAAQSKGSLHQFGWLFLYTSVLLFTLVLGMLMMRRGPDVKILLYLIYFCGALAILYQPRWGIFLILFFALTGDSTLMPWHPFLKNFSSAESIFYLHSSVIVSPMETYIGLTFLSWLGKDILMRKVRFYRGPFFMVLVALLFFLIFGLVIGYMNRGNTNIALWEVRPFFHLIAIVILCSNLINRKEHYNYLIWLAAIGITIKCIVAVYHYFNTLGGSLAGVNALMEHAASIQINSIFILILASWMYGASINKRFGLLITVPLMGIAYLASQRRAAILALIIAIVFMFMLYYLYNRRVFWVIVPALTVVACVYLVVFWNNSGILGLPSRAVKSVIAQNTISERDQSSNVYRLIENYNLGYTIHQYPLTGVGFGNVFLVPIPMPDISFYVWWNYFPHNSIIYIWLKTGLGGFLTFMFLIGTTIITGTRAVIRVKDPELKTIVSTVLMFACMHFMFAYVDIAWDTQSMVYLGVALGVLNSVEHVLSLPENKISKRYPWQADPKLQPNLLPMPGSSPE